MFGERFGVDVLLAVAFSDADFLGPGGLGQSYRVHLSVTYETP